MVQQCRAIWSWTIIKAKITKKLREATQICSLHSQLFSPQSCQWWKSYPKMLLVHTAYSFKGARPNTKCSLLPPCNPLPNVLMNLGQKGHPGNYAFLANEKQNALRRRGRCRPLRPPQTPRASVWSAKFNPQSSDHANVEPILPSLY